METNCTSITVTFPTDRTNHKRRTATEQRHKQRQQKRQQLNSKKNQKNHQRQKQQRQQQHQQEFDNFITSITLS